MWSLNWNLAGFNSRLERSSDLARDRLPASAAGRSAERSADEKEGGRNDEQAASGPGEHRTDEGAA